VVRIPSFAKPAPTEGRQQGPVTELTHNTSQIGYRASTAARRAPHPPPSSISKQLDQARTQAMTARTLEMLQRHVTRSEGREAEGVGRKVVGGHANRDGTRVASPAEALEAQGFELGSENAEVIGRGVAGLINHPSSANIVGQQLASEGMSQAEIANMNPEQRAQCYWDSLSATVEGRSVQVQLASRAYSYLLGNGELVHETEGRGAER